ncbi:helix-turn-helix domain-containing protein [Flavobacterium poyangense]|uniref:helix-turn-helix domain-containing protein n=1 Tax=Flavobacterium poyangense TaxID=2204302 RepID=UPI00141E919B|nr:helix-turn-helix domain-containing protein [Flavobacterium sp. JXAS1]
MTPSTFRQTFILLFLCASLVAQTSKKNLTELSYLELKELFMNNEQNKKLQLECAKAYLNKANKDGVSIEKARGLYLLGLLKQGNEAIKLFDSVIYYSKDLNDTKFPAFAYHKKAYQLKNQFKYKEAIDNFLIAERIAKSNNPDFYYKVKFAIALLRSEELGEVNEALVLYKECYNYYKKKDISEPQNYYAYQNVVFALADAYKALNQTDSTTYYNKIGYKESKLPKYSEYNALFILNEGANMTIKKNYSAALDSINKALPKLIFHKNTDNVLAAYYYLGQTHDGLNNKEKAVKNFIKVDSIYTITKSIAPEFKSGYPYLIEYYKNKGDKANQLKYLTRYMHIDSVLQANYKELTKKLRIEYDTPNLILEKESLIRALEKDNILSHWGISALFLLVILAIAFGYYQYQSKKKQRARFEKIMQKEADTVNPTEIKTKKQEKINREKTTDIGINEELVAQILEKLEKFELEKRYLESSITLQSLSDAFDTNNRYVSKIVNLYKEKTFIQYINDLRIEHAIALLKEDKKLRKYTIQALALEFGFNNAESFSIAFYKKTGIKPTYFIKQIEESTKPKTV